MKSKQSWMGRQSKRVLTGIMSLAAIVCTTALAQAPAPEPAAKQETGNTAVPSSQATTEKAWGILRDGLKEENAEKRAKAVRSLGLLTGNLEAEKAAVSALQDRIRSRPCVWQRPRRWDPCKPNTPISNWKASCKTPNLRWSSRRQIRCSCSTTTLGMTSTTTC